MVSPLWLLDFCVPSYLSSGFFRIPLLPFCSFLASSRSPLKSRDNMVRSFPPSWSSSSTLAIKIKLLLVPPPRSVVPFTDIAEPTTRQPRFVACVPALRRLLCPVAPYSLFSCDLFSFQPAVILKLESRLVRSGASLHTHLLDFAFFCAP